MKFLTDHFYGFLFWLNGLVGNLGWSVVLFTLLIKIIVLPIDWYSFLQEKRLQKVSAKIKEIFQQYKKEPEKQMLLLSETYKEAKYNPLIYFLAQMIQIPIFLAFFLMLRDLTKEWPQILFLGINLAQPSIFLALMTILLQFLVLQQIPQTQRKFSYLFLGLIALIIFSFPAIFVLYWMTNLILTLLERQIFSFYEKKLMVSSIQEKETDLG